MIIWLASYPRSGNTLLRMMLKSAFQRDSFSKYDDIHDIGADPRVAEVVGHRMLGEAWTAAYRRLADDPHLHLIKTHDPPDDDAPAIYVVREGRSAAVSYHKYLARFPADSPIELADVIGGFVAYGSWSEHLDAWNPRHRPSTLFLTFEQLLADPEPQIARIAEFCRIQPTGPWQNPFDSAQKMSPEFFRQGSADKSIAQVQGDELQLFWLLHGDWMAELGYGRPDADATAGRRALRQSIARHRRRAADQAQRVSQLQSAVADLRAIVEERARGAAAYESANARLRGALRDGADQARAQAQAVADLGKIVHALSARIDQWNHLPAPASPPAAAPASPPLAPAKPSVDEWIDQVQAAQKNHRAQSASAGRALARLQSQLTDLEQFTLRPPPMPMKMAIGELLGRFTARGRKPRSPG